MQYCTFSKSWPLRPKLQKLGREHPHCKSDDFTAAKPTVAAASQRQPGRRIAVPPRRYAGAQSLLETHFCEPTIEILEGTFSVSFEQSGHIQTIRIVASCLCRDTIMELIIVHPSAEATRTGARMICQRLSILWSMIVYCISQQPQQ